MAYIEKEKAQVFLRTECLAKYPASFANGLLAAADQLNKLPTADVAPKSEVAREIFEEIETCLYQPFDDIPDDPHYQICQQDYEAIKKTYTEEKE